MLYSAFAIFTLPLFAFLGPVGTMGLYAVIYALLMLWSSLRAKNPLLLLSLIISAGGCFVFMLYWYICAGTMIGATAAILTLAFIPINALAVGVFTFFVAWIMLNGINSLIKRWKTCKNRN
jgi:hypothetical protein